MRTLKFTVGILLAYVSSFAQGIHFTEFASWSDLITKAKKEKKYIFIDCFATWCGPCKKMDELVFSQKNVGEFFNASYISVRIQFDSTKNDSEIVKKWHTVARGFEKDYQVMSYPTYLFFNPDGKLVAKEFGLIIPPDTFINKASNFLDPTKQYYTLKDQYLGGDRTSKLVLKLLPEAIKLGDVKMAFELHNQYVDVMARPYVKSELINMYSSISRSDDKGFLILVNEPKEINNILSDEGRAEEVIRLILRWEVYTQYVKENKLNPNWVAIQSYLDKKAPNIAKKLFMELKANNALDRKDYELFGKLRLDYYDKYASSFDHNTKFLMNNELMEIFMVCFNKTVLKRAADWSKTTIYRVPGEESPAAIDTYANLLYKAGEIKQAMIWQEHALEVALKANDVDPKPYIDNLNKMKKRERTW